MSPEITVLVACLRKIADQPELLEVGRQAIENELISFRDSRLALPLRGNGLVIAERDGTRSHIIRMGPEDGLRIGLKAIAEHLEKTDGGSE